MDDLLQQYNDNYPLIIRLEALSENAAGHALEQVCASSCGGACIAGAAVCTEVVPALLALQCARGEMGPAIPGVALCVHAMPCLQPPAGELLLPMRAAADHTCQGAQAAGPNALRSHAPIPNLPHLHQPCSCQRASRCRRGCRRRPHTPRCRSRRTAAGDWWFSSRRFGSRGSAMSCRCGWGRGICGEACACLPC